MPSSLDPGVLEPGLPASQGGQTQLPDRHDWAVPSVGTTKPLSSHDLQSHKFTARIRRRHHNYVLEDTDEQIYVPCYICIITGAMYIYGALYTRNYGQRIGEDGRRRKKKTFSFLSATSRTTFEASQPWFCLAVASLV